MFSLLMLKHITAQIELQKCAGELNWSQNSIFPQLLEEHGFPFPQCFLSSFLPGTYA